MQLDNGTAQRGFTAAGLTDDAQRFALIHIQRNITEGVQNLRLLAKTLAFQLKFLGQMRNPHQGLSGIRISHGSLPPLWLRFSPIY